MKQPSLKKNFVLNTIYQILIIVIPFISMPYISRVLGAGGVGTYSYTYSIQTYFAMFAALGTVTYGTREIARVRENEEERSRLFWEIELLTVLTSLACLILWGIWILFNHEYRMCYVILTINIIAVIFDISWFYAGMEQFEYIVRQNTIFKVLGLISLFVFVKHESDLHLYIAIMAASTLLGNMTMWLYLGRFLKKVNVKEFNLKRHFKETLIYFVPTIATSIYSVLDKTLIGAITKDANENGYYEQATNIVNAAKVVSFVAINGVMESRSSFLFAQGKTDRVKSMIEDSMNYILFMGFGLIFGLVGVADEFVPWFFGPGFYKVPVLIKMLSPVIVIIGVSHCLGSQYYTPSGRRAQSAKFIITGSVINLVLNLILIPKFWSYGAVIASVIAECVITFLYMRNCDGYLRLSQLVKIGWKKLLAGIIMAVVLIIIHINMFIEIMIGIALYIICLVILRDSSISQGIRMLKNKG